MEAQSSGVSAPSASFCVTCRLASLFESLQAFLLWFVQSLTSKGLSFDWGLSVLN